MSDFRIHPVLRSPFVAAVMFGVVGLGVVNVGIGDILHAAGESRITAEDWTTVVNLQCAAAGISGMLAWFAWFVLFRAADAEIRVPLAGILLGVIGPLMGVNLIWSMYQSTLMPEFQDGLPAIWRLAALWSGLAVLAVAGCIRFGLRSYRAIRGVS